MEVHGDRVKRVGRRGMRLPVAARLGLRELRGGLAGFRVFIACLALGVAAIAAVGTVRQAIREGLEREASALLGGDAEVEFTYRFADAGERAWMDGIAHEVSEIVDFRSMAVVPQPDGGDERTLVQVKAVDAPYPLYGEVELAGGGTLSAALAEQDDLPGLVAQRILIDRLGLETGDVVRLGTRDFRLAGELVAEPDSGSAMAQLKDFDLLENSKFLPYRHVSSD
jgi:putative ABC transport system permease protein